MMMNKKKIAALIVSGGSSSPEKKEQEYGHTTEDQEVKDHSHSDDSEFGLKVAVRDLMKSFEAQDYDAASKALQEFYEICSCLAPKKEPEGED